MDIEIKTFRTDNYELAKKAFKIRTLVFVKEQDVDPKIEYDEYENQCQHYLVYVDGNPIGAARWRETGAGIRLERFAILPEYRNNKLGEKLLKKMLQDVLPKNKPIYLHSQVRSQGVYERNGFVAKGDVFNEADIDHIYMEYQGPKEL
ncbi:MAG: GNAT family N-acetyltransferase [Bacteroidales bacterium]|nr:GNAT family N-acetyltransferase [Bacteroidales bacterium]MCF8386235.1 GNAT family N-acetyltransferase [Bacteroidales bacterium]MCF8397488.1 GNAT family N-acetyltransferase [Bacteroidales bacterium]